MFNFYAFFTYIFTAAYTPGPNNIMSMSNAGRFGFRKSFPFNLGIFCGFLVVMVLCALFSAALFQIVPTAKQYMLPAGACYMLWLAWKTWKSPALETKDADSSSFISGMLLQFINPKLMIYGITAMSSYILPNFNTPVIILGFAMLLAFVGFTGTVCWSVFGAAFKILFSKYTKIVNGVMALLLVYCAVSLFL